MVFHSSEDLQSVLKPPHKPLLSWLGDSQMQLGCSDCIVLRADDVGGWRRMVRRVTYWVTHGDHPLCKRQEIVLMKSTNRAERTGARMNYSLSRSKRAGLGWSWRGTKQLGWTTTSMQSSLAGTRTIEGRVQTIRSSSRNRFFRA